MGFVLGLPFMGYPKALLFMVTRRQPDWQDIALDIWWRNIHYIKNYFHFTTAAAMERRCILSTWPLRLRQMNLISEIYCKKPYHDAGKFYMINGVIIHG